MCFPFLLCVVFNCFCLSFLAAVLSLFIVCIFGCFYVCDIMLVCLVCSFGVVSLCFVALSFFFDGEVLACDLLRFVLISIN